MGYRHRSLARNRAPAAKTGNYAQLNNPYLALAAAIINQAVDDAEKGQRDGVYPKFSNKYELRRFFKSQWFHTLCLNSLDGDAMAERLGLNGTDS